MTIEPHDAATDRYREWAAAYLLGALIPNERREFEAHLRDCASCSRELAELAGIPGLLARVPPEAVVDDADSLRADDIPPMPSTLTPPALLPDREGEPTVNREPWRRRRRWRVVVAGVAAAALSAGLAVLITVSLVSSPTQPANPHVAAARAMAPVQPAPITADFQLVDLGNGRTEIRVNCQYQQSSNQSYAGGFVMTITTADGRVQRTVAWWIHPDQSEYHPIADVNVPWSRIRTVQITDMAGNTLMTAQV